MEANVRSQVTTAARRGRDNLREQADNDPYRLATRYRGSTTCPTCGATVRGGRWTWDRARANAPTATCPACRRIADGYCAGSLEADGQFVREHREALEDVIRAEARAETAEHPLHRLATLEQTGDGLRVLTSDVHLARRLGEALRNAHGGELDVNYAPDEARVRVRWTNEESRAGQRGAGATPWPLELEDEGVIITPEARRYLFERLARVDSFASGIMSGRVRVESVEGHHRKGGPYRVAVKLELPGHTISVTRQEATDLHVAIRTAFDAVYRQLEDVVRRRHDRLMPRADDRHFGFVARIFPDAGYGFIEGEDGREIYFHRNAVLHGAFDELWRGSPVRYAEEIGEEGPQATTVAG